MRQRLLLTVALAVLAAATVGGSVGAAPNVLGSQSGVSVELPAELQDMFGKYECLDGIDNDGDGNVDFAGFNGHPPDPDCNGNPMGSETGSTGGGGGGGGSTTNPPSSTTTPPSSTTTTTTPETEYGEEQGGKEDKGKDGKGKDGKGKPKGQGGKGKSNSKSKGKGGSGGTRARTPKTIRKQDGTPTKSNPGISIAEFGPAPVRGVPSFMISQFEIPPFMLPIYQACGTQYSIPWPILASIHKIESNFGTNMGPSSAGAVGQMQFLPSTWRAYGVDANNDGRKDPYNPLDAVCAAARYLRASGGEDDLRRAIFAYNHADWYVDQVITLARQYGKLPDGLVGSLTGLTEGAHFPVAARARYADDVSERDILKQAKPRQRKRLGGVTAQTVSDSPTRRGINIFSREGAPVVAVNDGVIKKIGRSEKLGRYVVLEDAYGNQFTYARLGRVAELYPVPKQQELTAKDFEIVDSKGDPVPKQPASVTTRKGKGQAKAKGGSKRTGPIDSEDLRPRLYAYPERPRNLERADLSGQLDALFGDRLPGYETVKAYFGNVLRFDRRKMTMRPLRKGSHVIAGTVLGRIGKTDDDLAPHVNFAIKPAGKGAKRIDPKPILDGWKLLETTAIYRAQGRTPFNQAQVSQVLLMSKPTLQRHVLNNPRLQFHACGRDDVRTGRIDTRVLRVLAVVAARGFRLTITSLRCGRENSLTTSGSVSHHASGNAVDIAMINGRPVLGNQGKGSITEAVVREMLAMQEPNRCDQIITLMDLGGPSFAMADHHDHIHCGFTPRGGGKLDQEFETILKPAQWEKLINRIRKIDQPKVSRKPSKYALPSRKGNRRGSPHVGE